jgi:hypothetical protein
MLPSFVVLVLVTTVTALPEYEPDEQARRHARQDVLANRFDDFDRHVFLSVVL